MRRKYSHHSSKNYDSAADPNDFVVFLSKVQPSREGNISEWLRELVWNFTAFSFHLDLQEKNKVVSSRTSFSAWKLSTTSWDRCFCSSVVFRILANDILHDKFDLKPTRLTNNSSLEVTGSCEGKNFRRKDMPSNIYLLAATLFVTAHLFFLCQLLYLRKENHGKIFTSEP